MDRDSDTFGSPPEAVEKPLIDAAWAQFERLAAGHKAPGADGRRAFAVPGYRLLREIHRGGQGVVYQALQESTGRKVAIKVLKEGPFADEAELARFNREADLLTRLNHPHIVAIHDRGTTGDGHAYYMMDYIPGRALDAHVSGEGLSTSEILVLFHKICEAVNAAHLRGIIHRDLKPSNIRIDEQGEPRILDFGLAKLAHDAEGSGTMTITGQFVGSLPWASPEQAEGRSDLLDVRTDVYSLGVILYQLVTRSFPYPVSGNMNDVVRNIVHAAPSRPTTITRGLDRDVEVILLKCLEKDADRRYQSAGELARDIQRYLNAEPIEARPASSYYQIQQFARRNKAVCASLTAVFAVLVGGIVVSTSLYLRAERARAEQTRERGRAEVALTDAEAARDEAEEVTRFLSDTLASVDPGKEGKDVMVREVLDNAANVIGEKFRDRPLIEARLRQTVAWSYFSLGLYGSGEPHAAEAAAIYRRIKGEQDPSTLSAMSTLATIIGTRGDLNRGEATHRATLEIKRRVLGDEHPDTLASMHNMAVALQDQGRYAEAEELRLKVLEVERRVLGDEHPDTLLSMNNLAISLHAQGRYTEADELRRKALEVMRRVLGDEHPDTLKSMHALANSLANQGRYAEAEELRRKTLEVQRRVLGDEHPDTLASMNNLAISLHLQGRYAEAEELFRKTLEVRRRVLGDEHRQTLGSMHNLACSLLYQGRYPDAEELFRKTLEVRRRVLGERHPDVAETLSNLAELMERIRRWSEAEAYCREADSIWTSQLDAGHPLRQGNKNLLGGILAGQGRFSEAEPMLLESYKALRGAGGLSPAEKNYLVGRWIRLYEDWDTAEPGKGYDAKAAEWRAKLAELTGPAKFVSP
jgi:tetratricopeptide (TPR) repeat protein